MAVTILDAPSATKPVILPLRSGDGNGFSLEQKSPAHIACILQVTPYYAESGEEVEVKAEVRMPGEHLS